MEYDIVLLLKTLNKFELLSCHFQKNMMYDELLATPNKEKIPQKFYAYESLE